MYVKVDFISIAWFELWATRRKRESKNEKVLTIAGLKPTISRI